MMGEILLVVDGQVQDSATYKTDAEGDAIFIQFMNVKKILMSEHPYLDVRIDTRRIEE